MGRAGKIDYFWMNTTSFRSGTGAKNLRSCVDARRAHVAEAGLEDSASHQIDLILAELFPLINTCKGMQDIFIDAQLGSKVNREVSLDESEASAIDRLVTGGDNALVRQQFADLFVGDLPPKHVLARYDKAFFRWMVNAAQAQKLEGILGLRRYMSQDVNAQIAKYRKRGGDPEPRRFVNMVCHTAKIAFYACYANAWIDLSAGLRDHFGLSDQSMRFMNLWHGLRQGEAEDDIFHGQVLALHPLSGFVMNQPEHRVAIGDWLVCDELHRPESNPYDLRDPHCRNAVKTILISAAEYKYVWAKDKHRRR